MYLHGRIMASNILSGSCKQVALVSMCFAKYATQVKQYNRFSNTLKRQCKVFV